jgi:DNA-binding Lrp family transcriptional regulator
MCCWRVDGDIAEAGRALAASPDVTHCYERDPVAEFPFNLYAMVHSRSREDVLHKFADLSARLGDFAGSALMVSTKEYKKTSLSFFASFGIL